MNEYLSAFINIFLISGFFLLLYVVNYYYQQKAEKNVDEILRSQPKEFNKQIKSKAFGYLIGKILWSLLFLGSGIYTVFVNFQKLNPLMLINFMIAAFFIIWGVRGFRKELKRLIPIEENT